MIYPKFAASATVACSVALVSAHGHVDWLITGGIAYRGYDAPAFSWNPNIEPLVGWTTGATDNGFVEPQKFGDSDIICHRNAKSARGHVTVRAGDRINLQWNTWPESHKGPVIDYLAKCPGNCENVDKNQLEFFKIGASGLIDMSLQNGKWAADVLIGNGFSWTVQIPVDLASGNYVLRHEIIALHGSGQPNGAQNYLQCFNLRVVGGGSLSPIGVKGTALYKPDNPGILFNLYTTPLSYYIPGPTLVAGLPANVSQGSTRATATSSASTPGQNEPSAISTQLTTSQYSSQVITPTAIESTIRAPATVTVTAYQTLDPSAEGIVCGPASGGVPLYSQCGGRGYTGPTVCAWGSVCKEINPWYFQCLRAV